MECQVEKLEYFRHILLFEFNRGTKAVRNICAVYGDNGIILPVVLYGCETWSLTLREEHRLRVFQNKVLRKIFEAKEDEIT